MWQNHMFCFRVYALMLGIPDLFVILGTKHTAFSWMTLLLNGGNIIVGKALIPFALRLAYHMYNIVCVLQQVILWASSKHYNSLGAR